MKLSARCIFAAVLVAALPIGASAPLKAEQIRFRSWDQFTPAEYALVRDLMLDRVRRLVPLDSELRERDRARPIQEALQYVQLGRGRLTRVGEPALFMMIRHDSECGTDGCPIYIFVRRNDRWRTVDGRAFFGNRVDLLVRWDHGYRRMRINGNVNDGSRIDFVWDGRRYWAECLAPPAQCGFCDDPERDTDVEWRCAERPRARR